MSPASPTLTNTGQRGILGRLRGYGNRPIDGKARPILSDRAALSVIVLLAVVALVEAGVLIQQIVTPGTTWDFGQDYVFYRDVGARWLADGTYYLPHQLTGEPYGFAAMRDVLYPPTALPLFVALVFTPALLWWAVPAAVIGYALYRWRPGRWAIAGMLLLLCWPRSIGYVLYGNTDMLVMASVAGGLLWGWPAALIVIKPTMAPLALLGIKRRSWWVACVVLAVLSLAMLPLWFDYLTAMRNLGIGLDYSIGSLPLVLVPLVAWAGRTKEARPPKGSGPVVTWARSHPA